MEINYGPFESVLEMPEGYDLSQAKAAYLNGFLRIDVPVVQRSVKHTKVPVAEGSSAQLTFFRRHPSTEIGARTFPSASPRWSILGGQERLRPGKMCGAHGESVSPLNFLRAWASKF